MRLNSSIRIHLLQITNNILAHASGKTSNSFLDWLTETWIQLPTFNCIKIPKLPWYNELSILLSVPLSVDLGNAVFITMISHTTFKASDPFLMKEVQQVFTPMEFTCLTSYFNCPEEAGLIQS